jgi:hypothetical protein
MNMKVRRTHTWLGHFSGFISALLLLASPVTAGSPPVKKAKKPREIEVARQVDRLFLKALAKKTALPPAADDETFLRRLSFDLTGKLPTLEEVRAFVAANDSAKRPKQIDRYLAGKAYAVNWARYWRDVVTYHTPASGNYLRWPLFDRWLVEQVNRNRPFGEIVTALVTATGINDECAPVNYLTAQFGNPIEIAATTSRVFLGVQLQCAQCHDAKSEKKWKREQFHELVAFFGRARLVQHKDVDKRGTPYAIEGRADGQYRMPDQKNPKRLIVMRPRFLTGETVSLDANDRERRAALARFLTSPKNPWFTRSYVNRMWTSLMGWGFYPGVSDLGSEIEPLYPEVLNLLAKEWTATGYDMKWLFRTLTLTQAYQRKLQPRGRSQAVPVAVCPSRLRPEQIFEALVTALGFNEFDKRIPAPAPSSAPAVARHSGLRHMVYQTFKVDPSLPLDEMQGTIPQALLLMNSVLVNTYITATGNTFLAQALIRGQSDDEILKALYQRTLARQPKPREMAICKRYLKKVGKRQEALEDIFWSLINSTEFLTKR